MSSALPTGEAAPEDGRLPDLSGTDAASRNFGVYIHVPFCRVRCGYCDFNTYTATELGGFRQSDYSDQAIAEIELASGVLKDSGLPARAVSTVFFGGGTPTLLPAGDLGRMLDSVRRTWGLEADAEITTEANPDSVDLDYLKQLRRSGFTRVSFGMQSAVPRVLATLDRTHNPQQVPKVVGWARDAGLDVSLDLIYGTPGESIDDWQESLESAVAMEPDHLSAYCLIVERGTKLERQIRRGEVPPPDDELSADKYELADEMLRAAGFDWYEVSNWARSESRQSRHNLSYWTGEDWWGIGPGAHSHIGGVRWWNVKHPAAYAERLASGRSPALAREILSEESKRLERILLESRIRAGLDLAVLSTEGKAAVAGLIADGMVDAASALRGRLVLTLKGRLLADAVVRTLDC